MNAVHLRDLDLNLLRVLHQLLVEQSAQRAAKRLGLTPSAVSHALRRLRDTFDDPLLVREGHRLVPTPRAERLGEPLQRVLAEIEGLLAHDAPVDPAKLSRTFVIGAADYGQLVLLPRLLERLAEVAPRVSLELVQPGSAIDAETRERRLDLAVGASFQELAGLVLTRYFTDALVVVTEARARAPTLKRYLEARHVLVSPRGQPGSIVDSALEARGLSRRVVLRMPNFSTAAVLVAGGELITTMPGGAARALARRLPLALHPVPLETPPIAFGAIFSEVYRFDPAHAWFRGLVAEVARAAGERAPTLARERRGGGGEGGAQGRRGARQPGGAFESKGSPTSRSRSPQ
jgi:DNA-binding transcriptional LysR family regulator